MNITKTSIKRPTLVVVIFTILTIFGLFSYQKLNQELLPKFSPSVITVSTIYPGASPSEVENSVTRNIEDAISSLEGVDQISSTSMESFSLTTIELKAGSDVDLILQDAQRKINAARSTLPDDVDEPTLGKFDFSEMPILNIGSTSKMEATEFYDLMDNKIKPMFERIPGVARVQLVGGNEREIQVNLNQEKLQAYGLSILQVSQLVNGSNLDFPTGKLNNGEQQTLIRLAGKYKSVNELENLVIKSYANGSMVKLKDVAEVKDSEKDPEIINRVNAVNSIGMTIQKQSDANAVQVSELAKKTLAELSDKYKDKGINFTIAQDSSLFTLDASEAVIHDLIDLKKNRGIYANYGQGFVPPQVGDLYKGNKVPLLKPVYFKNYEAGGWITFAHKHAKLDISFYQMDGLNEIVSVLQNDGSTVRQNSGKTRHKGIEYGLQIQVIKDLSIKLSGTNASHKYLNFDESGVDFSGNSMAQSPNWIANAVAMYKPSWIKGFRIGLEWQHIDQYYMDNTNTIEYPGYDIFNIRLGYEHKSFEIWTNILNATNQLYATVASASVWGQTYSLGNPRNINIGIAYKFKKQ